MSTRDLISMQREANRAKQQRAIATRNTPSPKTIGERDTRTGLYEVRSADGGVEYGKKIFNSEHTEGQVYDTAAQGGLGTPLAIEGKPATAPTEVKPLKKCPGYINGQVFNCVEEEEEYGKIAYLYGIKNARGWGLYIGGFAEGADVLVKQFDSEPIIPRILLDFIGSQKFGVSLAYGLFPNVQYEYYECTTKTSSLKWSVNQSAAATNLILNPLGMGYWHLIGANIPQTGWNNNDLVGTSGTGIFSIEYLLSNGKFSHTQVGTQATNYTNGTDGIKRRDVNWVRQIGLLQYAGNYSYNLSNGTGYYWYTNTASDITPQRIGIDKESAIVGLENYYFENKVSAAAIATGQRTVEHCFLYNRKTLLYRLQENSVITTNTLPSGLLVPTTASQVLDSKWTAVSLNQNRMYIINGSTLSSSLFRSTVGTDGIEFKDKRVEIYVYDNEFQQQNSIRVKAYKVKRYDSSKTQLEQQYTLYTANYNARGR